MTPMLLSFVTAIGTETVTPFGPSKGCAMLIVVQRSTARSACSLGVKPIFNKRADCRSPADGGVDAIGGVAVEKDEMGELGTARSRMPTCRIRPVERESSDDAAAAGRTC